MSKRNATTLQTANIRVFKYNITNAHRIVHMMNNEATPYATRRALRSALRRIALCTDMDRRECLRVENVAILLRIGVTYQDNLLWQKARKAHVELWETFNERDRIVNPQRWVKFDEAIRAYQERQRAQRRPRVRRAVRPRVAPAHRSPVAQQIAA